MRTAYEQAGIKSRQPTRSLRLCGVALAQASGLSSGDIEDHCKTDFYNIPAMRALAGFKPYDLAITYYLERAEVAVPEELLPKVFAGLDYW